MLALLVLSTDAIPAALWYSGAGGALTEAAKQWTICLLAFALGSTNYLASPTSDDSFLGASAFAATGATHKTVKTLVRLVLSPSEVSDQERQKTCQAFSTVVSILAGALLGSVFLFLNPFGHDQDLDIDDDSWLLVPVAAALYAVLYRIGRASAPTGGRPGALTEPLHAHVTSAG